MKKLISVLMSVLMVLTLMVPVFADETNPESSADEPSTVETQEAPATEEKNNLGNLIYDKLYFSEQNGLYAIAEADFSFEGYMALRAMEDGVGDTIISMGIDMTDDVIEMEYPGFEGKVKRIDFDPAGGAYSVLGGQEVGLYLNDELIKTFVTPDMNLYTITLDAQGGTFPEGTRDSVKIGVDEYVIPTDSPSFAPVKEGYVFKGWYAGTDLSLKYDYFVYDIVKNYDSKLYAKWEKEPLKDVTASFDEANGLEILFSNDELLNSLLTGISINDGAGSSGVVTTDYYDVISLSLIESDYSAYASIVNGVFDYGSGKIENSYIVKNDDKGVKVSADSLKELGLVNGKYSVKLTSRGNKVAQCNVGEVEITGLKDIDVSNDRVDTLYVDLSDDVKIPVVGDKVPYEIDADVYTIVDGNKVAVDGVNLEWAKKSIYKLGGGSDWYTSATFEPYYNENDELTYRSTPEFEANCIYYLSIEYHPYAKDYANEFKLVINGSEVDVNGRFIGRGAGGGLSYFYVSTTEKYCSTIPYGYAEAKTQMPDSFTEEEKASVNTKLNYMFTKSDASDNVNSTNQLVFESVANTASGEGANASIKEVVGEGGKIEVNLRETVAEKVNDNVVVTKMSFDVTPKTAADEPKHGNVGTTVTFRLPVDKDADYKYANVEHEGTFLAQCEVKGDAENGKYIEVSSNEFSVFSYTLTNVEHTVPSAPIVDDTPSTPAPVRKPVVNTSVR